MPSIRHSVPSLALGGVVLFVGCGPRAEPPPPTPRPIAWTEVERLPATLAVRLPATVRAVQRAPLAFEVGGRVASVAKEIGERFEAGEVLASLDDRTYRLSVAQRRASLIEARAAANEASENFRRASQLVESGVFSRQEFDAAQQTANSSASRVAQAEAAVALAEKDLADTELHAPYAGEVSERLVEPAQQVTPGDPVYEIQGHAAGIEAIFSVPERIGRKLPIGSSHAVTFPARPDLTLTGRVTEISSRTSDGNAIPAKLHLVDPPADLRPGMTAEVSLAVPTDGSASPGSVQIPLTAFRSGSRDTMESFVFDPTAKTLTLREVEIAEMNEDHAIVSNGLVPGDVIATKGLPFLSDGQAVELLGEGIDRYNP